MTGTMYIAASAALDHQRRLEVLTNNLANANTTGFKADDLAFHLEMRGDGQPGTQVKAAEPSVPTGTATETDNMMPTSMRMRAYTDFSSGSSRHTGSPLDVALEGDGFFSVQTPSGVQYTRQGSFTLNQDGKLVTSDGYPVMGEGGEITIEGNRVTIDEAGSIYVDGNEVDRLQITAFDNLKVLSKAGSSLFKAAGPGAGPQPAENVVVKQGYLENSNVNAIRTMTDMIAEMRIVEAYQKMIRTADNANTKAVNELGRIV